MNEKQILDKRYWSKLDKLTVFILESISRLHDEKIKYEDMNQIYKDVAAIWRKYHSIEELTTVESHMTSKEAKK